MLCASLLCELEWNSCAPGSVCVCMRMVWCVCLNGSWQYLHSVAMNDIKRLGRLLYSSPFSLWAALDVDPIELCYPKQLTLTAKNQ